MKKPIRSPWTLALATLAVAATTTALAQRDSDPWGVQSTSAPPVAEAKGGAQPQPVELSDGSSSAAIADLAAMLWRLLPVVRLG